MNLKRLFNSLMVGMMLVTSFAMSQPAEAAPAGRSREFAPMRLDAPHVEGEIVVVMSDAEDKSLPAIVADAFATAEENQAELTRLTADGVMLLEVDESQLAARINALNKDPNVLYAEPNYTVAVSDPTLQGSEGYKINSEYVARAVQPSAATGWNDRQLVSIADLKAMQRKKGATAMATYPNDPGVFDNYGWSAVGADIVWPNTTASAGICVVDSGVDSKHPEFAERILPGYDFVWGDSTPQDDYGHGTHVAGIIIAKQNNKIGMAGASTGKISPVKVLDAQGYGTIFDVAAGINWCANRNDIKVINLSLGSVNPSTTLHDALVFAVNTKNKLVVVAAGNFASSTPTYPAGYADDAEFLDKVISVAASGKDLGTEFDYDLPLASTNYGDWVSVAAPGGYIYSTTPYDKSFYLNTYEGVETRYAFMSGTSMAAPFVAAAAARYWGYKPALTNVQVGQALQSPTYGNLLDTTSPGAWDSSMDGKVQVNIAKLLDRGALQAGVIDASTGTPLTGAVISAFQGGVSRGTGVIKNQTFTDVINLPVLGGGYSVRVNKANFTVGNQSAFQHESSTPLTAGTWTPFSDTAVPPKTANFAVVLVWKIWHPAGLEDADVSRGFDLDMDLWLPAVPNPNGPQPSSYVVGMQSDPNNPAHQPVVGDAHGSASSFPFARLVHEGGYVNDVRVETIVIRNRFQVNSPLAINAALPYYPSEYSVYATDYGQTIDHDGDGCGDNYGRGAFFDPNYDNTCGGVGTPGIPVMGTYFTPYVYIWKDGVIKKFADGSQSGLPWPDGSECNDHWWKAVTIGSGATGTAPQYEDNFTSLPTFECDDKGDDTGYFPYAETPESGGVTTGTD